MDVVRGLSATQCASRILLCDLVYIRIHLLSNCEYNLQLYERGFKKINRFQLRLRNLLNKKTNLCQSLSSLNKQENYCFKKTKKCLKPKFLIMNNPILKGKKFSKLLLSCIFLI